MKVYVDCDVAVKLAQWGLLTRFTQHLIMGSKPEENPQGVVFSQPHAQALVDVDRDGLPDLVTGKRYYAHNGRDPGENDPPEIAWYELSRGAGVSPARYSNSAPSPTNTSTWRC